MSGGVLFQQVIQTSDKLYLLSITEIDDLRFITCQFYSLEKERFSPIEPEIQKKKVNNRRNRNRYRPRTAEYQTFLIYDGFTFERSSTYTYRYRLHLYGDEQYLADSIKDFINQNLNIKNFSVKPLSTWHDLFPENEYEPENDQNFIAPYVDGADKLNVFSLEELISNYNIKIRRRLVRLLYHEKEENFYHLFEWLLQHAHNGTIFSIFRQAFKIKSNFLIKYALDILTNHTTYSNDMVYFSGTMRLAFLYLFEMDPTNDYFDCYNTIFKDFNNNYPSLIEAVYSQNDFFLNYNNKMNKKFVKEEFFFLLFQRLSLFQKYEFVKNFRHLENDFNFRKRLVKYFDDSNSSGLILFSCFENGYGSNSVSTGFWTRLSLKKLHILAKNNPAEYAETTTLLLSIILSNYQLGKIQKENDRMLGQGYFNQLLYLLGLKLSNLNQIYDLDRKKHKINGTLLTIKSWDKLLIFKRIKLKLPFWEDFPEYILLIADLIQKSPFINSQNQFNLYFGQLFNLFIEDDKDFQQILEKIDYKTVLRWFYVYNIDYSLKLLISICKKNNNGNYFKRILNYAIKNNYLNNVILFRTLLVNRPDEFFYRVDKSYTIKIAKKILPLITENENEDLFFQLIEDLDEDFWDSKDNKMIKSNLKHPNKSIKTYFLILSSEMNNSLPNNEQLTLILNSESSAILTKALKLCTSNKDLFVEDSNKLVILIDSNLPQFENLGLEIYNGTKITTTTKIDIIKILLNKPECKFKELFISDIQKIFDNDPTEDIIIQISEHPNRQIQSEVIKYFYLSLLKIANSNIAFVLFYCRTILFTPRSLAKAKEMSFSLLKELYISFPSYKKEIINLLTDKARSNTLQEKERALVILAEVS